MNVSKKKLNKADSGLFILVVDDKPFCSFKLVHTGVKKGGRSTTITLLRSNKAAESLTLEDFLNRHEGDTFFEVRDVVSSLDKAQRFPNSTQAQVAWLKEDILQPLFATIGKALAAESSF